MVAESGSGAESRRAPAILRNKQRLRRCLGCWQRTMPLSGTLRSAGPIPLGRCSTRESTRSQGDIAIPSARRRPLLIGATTFVLLCYSLSLHAGDKPTSLWLDWGTGVSVGGTLIQSAKIGVATFARYRISQWEIIGGGWYSGDEDVSNLTVGGGYVVRIWRGLNFTGGLALADKSAQIGTYGRFYFAGRWDFRCWSVGYVHFSNGMQALNHNLGPNNGVDLLVGSRKLHC